MKHLSQQLNMVKRYALITALWILPSVTLSQKKPVSFQTYKSWPSLDYYVKVTKNGKHLIYGIKRDTCGPLTILISTDSPFPKRMFNADVSSAFFSADERFLIYKTITDTLFIINLNTNDQRFIDGVKSFKIPSTDNSNWIAYQNGDRDMIIYNLLTGKKQLNSSVKSYYFNTVGTTVLYLKEESSTTNHIETLLNYNYIEKKTDTIIKTTKYVENIVFDNSGSRIAFTTEDKDSTNKDRKIWYYKKQMKNAVEWVNQTTLGMNKTWQIGTWKRNFRFSKDGRNLFFPLQISQDDNLKNSALVNSADKASVDVWDYRDTHLQTEQLANTSIDNSREFMATISESAKTVILLETPNDNPLGLKIPEENDKYVFISSDENSDERYWNPAARPSFSIISTESGERRLIKDKPRAIDVYNISISPDGKYIVWFDRERKHFFCYNVSTSVEVNISMSIPYPVHREEFTQPDFPPPYGIAGWSKNSQSIFLYDQFDIWQVDVYGSKQPTNLTHGFGRSNNIVFRIENTNKINPLVTLNEGQTVLLNSFDKANKNAGFFSLKLNSNKNPLLLSTGAFKYDVVCYIEKTKSYILRRMSAKDAPNLYITKGFNTMLPLSNIAPQKDYNWLTVELIHWKLPDNKLGEGKIFKPENFDTSRKYPVIITFYEIGSDALNWFMYPELSDGVINIPYFVSNGYIVFQPNMTFHSGKIGDGVCNTILSATKYLTSLPWVDSSKIGLSGISFAAYQINYLVTQTNKFAAAAPAAGASDLVSGYNSIWRNKSAQWISEIGQVRMGKSLWQDSSVYIKYSPIFQVYKVETPLLILHNKDDEAVSWSQGIEWFTALRRLGKKSWLLQYDGEAHGLYQPSSKLDYSIRLAQFFNHYLKGDPAPKWMTSGVPAIEKNKDDGLYLTPLENCSPNCTICKKWNNM